LNRAKNGKLRKKRGYKRVNAATLPSTYRKGLLIIAAWMIERSSTIHGIQNMKKVTSESDPVG
jgi:hypothetical protein